MSMSVGVDMGTRVGIDATPIVVLALVNGRLVQCPCGYPKPSVTISVAAALGPVICCTLSLWLPLTHVYVLSERALQLNNPCAISLSAAPLWLLASNIITTGTADTTDTTSIIMGIAVVTVVGLLLLKKIS